MKQRLISIEIFRDGSSVFKKSPASPQDVIPALQLFEDGKGCVELRVVVDDIDVTSDSVIQ